MKISEVVTTPLWIPYEQPFHWSQGVTHGAEVILVEVHTDGDVVGYGESIATPSAEAIRAHLSLAADFCIGRSPFENARLVGEAYHALFGRDEACRASKFAGKALAGLEMALWDAMGKAVDRPVHALMGGAVRDEVRYFGFPQGDTAEEIAAEAARLVALGHEVIYVECGRGDDLDAEIVARVRAAIGPDKRLRLDPSGGWHPVQASRMMRRLSRFDIEVVEQPIDAESVEALARVRAGSPVAIAADQGVIALGDAFDVCRLHAADLIVVGLHETGGLMRFCKVAHIAEAANVDVCVHGLHETGITTVAAIHAASVTPNLDDGNQYMNNFLAWDIVRMPDLTLQGGGLPVPCGPGLGFELDWNAVRKAADAWGKGVDYSSRNTPGHRSVSSPPDPVDRQGVDGKAGDEEDAGAHLQRAPLD
ncbi:MAG: mandelate racemase/muconate lactonizing enzyme family protein [Rhodospirillales bacterium]|nr:mandelate racemase/muconate lactonizing enzyme family protein [Rhodospirillales bacterium]